MSQQSVNPYKQNCYFKHWYYKCMFMLMASGNIRSKATSTKGMQDDDPEVRKQINV